MVNLNLKVCSFWLVLSGSLGFVSLSHASQNYQLESERAGVIAPLVDQNDYYFHPDGRKIKFYRKQDVYAIESKPQGQQKATGVGTMARIKAQFRDGVSRVKEHRLGNTNVVRINTPRVRGKSSASAFKIQPSMLASLDSSIANVQPVLANAKGQGDILITSKVLLRLRNSEAADRDIKTLAKRFKLTVDRRLTTSGAVYQVDSVSSRVADAGQRFSFVRRLMQDPLVQWAQPVFKSKAIKAATFEPNDNLFDRQWHLRNTGQEGSLCDADCDANEAWDINDANGVGAVSGEGQVIAIIDDGVQLDHEDLLIWENTAEIEGEPGVDDDGNGLIDDFNGWDFVDDSLSPLLNPNADLNFCIDVLTANNDPSDGSGVKCRCQDNDGNLGPDNDPNPQNTSQCLVNDANALTSPTTVRQDNHGTAVAGLAAARGNNGLGVAGTAYSAQVMPIRLISDFDGDVNSDFCARIVEAMTYAGRHADVINNSWSIDEGTCPALDEIISSVVDGQLIDLEENNSKRPNLGSPVVFSAGNNASGWIKVTVPVSDGPHAYEWRFLRTADPEAIETDELALNDSAWIDDIEFPDGSLEDFNDGLPSGDDGFTQGCEVNICNEDCVVDDGLEPFDQCLLWSINDDPDFSRSGGSATIDHSENLSACNHSYFNIGKDGPAGDISFWIWVSTELRDTDKVEFLVDGVEVLSFGDIARLVDNDVAYPANLPKVIAVGASDSGDLSGETAPNLLLQERAPYSQYGPSLDILAPSSNQHLGMVTTDRYGENADGFNVDTAIDNEASPGRYTEDFFGTSAAAPVVAGIAAAMIAIDSEISASSVEQTLQATAEKIGRRGAAAYTDDVNGSTRSDFYGFGRVNMLNALQSVSGAPVVAAKTFALLDNIDLCAPEAFTYTPENDRILPNFTPDLSGQMCAALGPDAPLVDEICVPIRTQSGGVAVICL